MLDALLRRFAPIHQRQFGAPVVAVVAGAIGVRIGVHACYALAPPDSAFDFAALVVLFKLSKFCFAPCAIVGLARAKGRWERLGYLALLILVLALMAASVGPSYVFTTHIEGQRRAAAEASRAQGLADSDAYKTLTKDIETYDARIADAMVAVEKLRAINHHTQAKEPSREVAELQKAKDAKVAQRGTLRAAVLPNTALPGEIMRWVHLGAAILLELVGAAASVLVHIGRPVVASACPAVETAGALQPSGDGGTVVPIGASRRNPRAQLRAVPPSDGESLTEQRAARCPNADALQPSGGGHTTRRCAGERHGGAGGPRSVCKDLAERCAEARRMIEIGELDPSQEALARSFRISQRPATRLLKEMQDDGSIRWAGNRYLLVLSNARIAL